MVPPETNWWTKTVVKPTVVVSIVVLNNNDWSKYRQDVSEVNRITGKAEAEAAAWQDTTAALFSSDLTYW